MAQILKKTADINFKLGWIPYWNLLPLKTELRRAGINDQDIVQGHPAQVNRWLNEEKVNLAPCSSIHLIKQQKAEVAIPLGIASNGPVQSVYLGLQREHAPVLEYIRKRQHALRDIIKVALTRYGTDARKVSEFIIRSANEGTYDNYLRPPLALTSASATSATLSQILYRLWFGVMPQVHSSNSNGAMGITDAAPSGFQSSMELVIGDEALIRRSQYTTILDLGDVWKDLTGLPFVFAVWQSNKGPLTGSWRYKFIEAAELAQAKMRVDPTAYSTEVVAQDVSGKPIDLGNYWKHIQYRLTPAHFQAIALFFGLAKQVFPETYRELCVSKIVRLQSLSDNQPVLR